MYNQPPMECWRLHLLLSDALLQEDAPPGRQHTVVLHQSRCKQHRTITLTAILEVTNISFNIPQFKYISLWSFCLCSRKLTVLVKACRLCCKEHMWQWGKQTTCNIKVIHFNCKSIHTSIHTYKHNLKPYQFLPQPQHYMPHAKVFGSDMATSTRLLTSHLLLQ